MITFIIAKFHSGMIKICGDNEEKLGVFKRMNSTVSFNRKVFSGLYLSVCWSAVFPLLDENHFSVVNFQLGIVANCEICQQWESLTGV